MKKLILALMCCAPTLLALPAGHTQSQYLCSVESSMDSMDAPQIMLTAHHGCFGSHYQAIFMNEGTSTTEDCSVEGYEMGTTQLMCGSTMISFDGWKLSGTVTFYPGEPVAMTCMTMDNER